MDPPLQPSQPAGQRRWGANERSSTVLRSTVGVSVRAGSRARGYLDAPPALTRRMISAQVGGPQRTCGPYSECSAAPHLTPSTHCTGLRATERAALRGCQWSQDTSAHPPSTLQPDLTCNHNPLHRSSRSWHPLMEAPGDPFPGLLSSTVSHGYSSGCTHCISRQPPATSRSGFQPAWPGCSAFASFLSSHSLRLSLSLSPDSLSRLPHL